MAMTGSYGDTRPAARCRVTQIPAASLPPSTPPRMSTAFTRSMSGGCGTGLAGLAPWQRHKAA